MVSLRPFKNLFRPNKIVIYTIVIIMLNWLYGIKILDLFIFDLNTTLVPLFLKIQNFGPIF